MSRHGRSGLRSVIRDSWKVALGAAVGVLAGGAVVWGDGGDASLVHACILPDTAGPANARIVGENEPCAAEQTPRHWSIQGPSGAQGPPGDVTANAVADASKVPGLKPPSVKPSRGLLKKLKIKPGSTKTVKKAVGPNLNPQKGAEVFCPPTHPKFVTGGASMDPPAGQALYQVLVNHQWGPGWRALILRLGGGPWKLTVSVTCKK